MIRCYHLYRGVTNRIILLVPPISINSSDMLIETGKLLLTKKHFKNRGTENEKNGSSKTLIVNSQTLGITVVNDWIYYLVRDASGSQENILYKIKVLS